MQNVGQFIDALGGTVAVANAMELAPTTVSSWKSSNSIPKWREPALRTFANEQGVEYPEDFPQEPEADAA